VCTGARVRVTDLVGDIDFTYTEHSKHSFCNAILCSMEEQPPIDGGLDIDGRDCAWHFALLSTWPLHRSPGESGNGRVKESHCVLQEQDLKYVRESGRVGRNGRIEIWECWNLHHSRALGQRRPRQAFPPPHGDLSTLPNAVQSIRAGENTVVVNKVRARKMSDTVTQHTHTTTLFWSTLSSQW
jgi:hypothetical protein